ncbi:MAG: fused MFS/spermidine synthase [Armatimonadota bacterium]|nr:fused MFS/spermidine synthase [Armatimonadota bacterium]MDR7428276.1 fused MFS/spermidine synthase [Armatimonadota bacterium]MDR7464319.1 fused MFS/spermidine synthase [Armatimonadota bacterium]MDR7468929.1 fused MFS/spermidine synthase [Armatimonadota bacterium]MDR7475031.1 fused MFS/spermidine synthase [Armatimonadota bacterium]
MVLKVVVFGAGAALMGLEIVGSRVLAPYFGSSVYVWGSLISIFLGALSLGYYVGGRVADRWPRPAVLATALFAAGVLIIFLPLLSRPILERFADWDLGPRMSPLVTSTILFAPASVLLGMTSPFAVKLAATDLSTVGNVAGLLYAISTAGSIAGTLLTAFFLIPTFGVRAILYILGSSLVVFSLLLLAGVRAPRAMRQAVAALVAVVLLAGPGRAAVPAPSPAAEPKIVFEKDSAYHRIRVEDYSTVRFLRFDRSFQGGMYLHDPFESPFKYTDYAHLAWVFHPDIRRVLVVGLGAGSIPKRFWRDYPGVTVESVELDPVVVDVARRFFEVKEDARQRVSVQDGRAFVRRSDARYDLIVMDAYYAEGIPFHLATREFFELARSRLTPQGLIAANIVGALEGGESKLFRALYKTYGQVFAGLYPFPVAYTPQRDGTAVRTIILLATPRSGLTRPQILQAVLQLRRSRKVTLPLHTFVDDYYDRPIPTSDVPVLTDDYAPVDILPVWGWEPERR